MRVQSLASLSVLRIRHCGGQWCRLQRWLRSRVAVAVAKAGGYSSNSALSLGTSICCRCGSKKKDKIKIKIKINIFSSYLPILSSVHKGDWIRPPQLLHNSKLTKLLVVLTAWSLLKFPLGGRRGNLAVGRKKWLDFYATLPFSL